MILLFDQKQQFITEIGKNDILEAEQDHKLNGLWQANVTMRLKDWTPYKEIACYFGYLVQDIFYLYKITKAKANDQKISLSGVHIFFDELQGRTIKDKRPSNVTSQTLADLILKGTGWRAVATASGSRSMSFYYVSAAKAFENMINAFSCDYRMEIRLSGGKIIDKVVYIADSISKDYGKWYEYGDRLLKVIEEEDRKSVFTAVIGRGKALQTEAGGYGRKINFEKVEWKKSQGRPVDKPLGQEYVELPEATEVFGYADGSPRIVIKEFSDIEDPEQLLQASYEYALMVSHPHLLLKASAIPEEDVKLGEIVAIIRPDMDIRYKTKVVGVKTNLLTGISDITIGDRSQVSLVQAISNLSKTQAEDKLEVSNWIEEIQKALTHDLFNEDGFNYEFKAENPYNLPAGYYSFNAPIDQGPTKVIYIGAGKIAIANSKESDGSWNWRTFGTGEGFTADLIRTGRLEGGKVRWNLENGVMQIGDESTGSLVYDPEMGLILTPKKMTLPDELKTELKGKKGDPGSQGMPGKEGPPGKDGKDGASGKDGVGVREVLYEYASSTSAETPPASGWVRELPNVDSKIYVWTRVQTTYTDGHTETSSPQCMTSKQVQSALEEARNDAVRRVADALDYVSAADYADKAYLDGVLSNSERAILQSYEARMQAEREAMNADWEARLQSAVSVIESELQDQQSYLWMDGGNLCLGRKGSFTALTLSPEEVGFLVRDKRKGRFNAENLLVDNVRTNILEIREAGSEKGKFQWRHRKASGEDHLTLFYVGGNDHGLS